MDNDQLSLGRMMARPRAVFSDRKVVSRGADGVVELSYSEIFARVDRLAHALHALGVRPGDRVGTLAWNHHRHLELYLAVTMSGAVLHTVNARLAPEQAAQIVAHAGDAVLFCDGGLAPLVDQARDDVPGVPVVWMGRPATARDSDRDYEELLAAQPDGLFAYPDVDERAPAATSYSSATTGVPKGVVYSHRALYLHSMMTAMADTWAISESDAVLPVVPMFHVNAWGLPFTALWMGATLVLPGERPTADDVLELLAEHDVTFAAAVPTVWMDVLGRLHERGTGLPRLRMVVSGGAPLPPSLLAQADELGVPMIHSYGMTEASPLVLVGRPRSDAPAPGPELDELRLRQGHVVPGLDWRVEGEDGAAVPWDGESAGELTLRGPWVAESYERDERSARAFVDGWYHTGDIVSVDPRGYLKVVDRSNDLIKSGGEWISSIELENALMDHVDVVAAAVVSVPHERWDERPRAFVVRKPGASDEVLTAHLAARFPKFWIPDEFVSVDEIPVTSVGKFDKKRLRSRGTGT